MNRKKRLVIPLLLAILCYCFLPVMGYAAAGDTSQSMTLTLQVPEKPSTSIDVEAGKQTLEEIALPNGWVWQDSSPAVQPGRTIVATAVYADTGATMEIEITGTLEILLVGTNTQYIPGQSSQTVIHCNGTLDALLSVQMDGETVAPENYTTEEGSTILRFKQAYLDTLSQGNHTVTLRYEAGSIDCGLTVQPPAAVSVPVSPAPTRAPVRPTATATPTPTPDTATATATPDTVPSGSATPKPAAPDAATPAPSPDAPAPDASPQIGNSTPVLLVAGIVVLLLMVLGIVGRHVLGKKNHHE